MGKADKSFSPAGFSLSPFYGSRLADDYWFCFLAKGYIFGDSLGTVGLKLAQVALAGYFIF